MLCDDCLHATICENVTQGNCDWYMSEKEIRPQGEWTNHRNDCGHNIADCSVCGKAVQWHDEDEDGMPRFCWFCGAKMKGGEMNGGT